MSEHGISGGLPSSLRGYKLKKIHHGSRRLVLWIIILLVILWFVKKELILNLFDFLKDLFENLFKI